MSVVDDPVVGGAAGVTGAGGRSLVGRLRDVEASLSALSDDLVPERVAGREVVEVVRVLRRIERRAGGARLVLTSALAETGLWRQEGFASPEEWVARADGTTVGAAKADLAASKQLDALPVAREAVSRGEVSAEAARAAAEGATADPGVEGDLVAKAKTGDLRSVRDGARRARQRRDEREGGKAAVRHYQRRALRAWLELDGEGRGTWNVPASYQAAFLAALEPYRQEAFKAAREAGRRESHEALMADALYMLARDVLADHDLPEPAPGPKAEATPGKADRETATAPPGASQRHGSPDADAPGPRPSGTDRPTSRRTRRRRPPAQVHVHVDHDALRRGLVEEGETCEVEGLGPVPVAFARFLANDAVLRVVLTGTDVTVISSARRYVPAAVRRALEARDRACVAPGCTRSHHLEMDHWTADFAQGCPTSLDTLARLCRFHHHLKTHAGWQLTGGPGHWQFHPPGDRPPSRTDEPDEPP